MLAIRQRNAQLVRMLVERNYRAVDRDCGAASESEIEGQRAKKKRKMEDRVQVSSEMLKLAVKCNARDIVQYLRGKGCIPDMQTLRFIR